MKKFALQLLESYSILHEQPEPQEINPQVQQAIGMAAGKDRNNPHIISNGKGQQAKLYQTFNKKTKVTSNIFQLDTPNAYALKILGAGDNKGYDELVKFLAGKQARSGQGEGSSREQQLEQRREEAITELNDLQPGLGDSLAKQYDEAVAYDPTDLFGNSNRAVNMKNKLHEQYFSNSNYSLRTKMKKASERERLYLEQYAEEEAKDPEKLTLFERSPVTSDQTEQGMNQITRLMGVVAKLRRGVTSTDEARQMLEELKTTSKVLQQNRKGTVFLRVDENSLAGISFNSSEQHFITSLFNEYDELSKDFAASNPEILDTDDEGETIDNYSIKQFDLRGSSTNISSVVKESSELLEIAAHHIARKDYAKAEPIIRKLATQYKDSIEEALKLQGGMLDENTENMREVLDAMGIDENSKKDEVTDAVYKIVSGHMSRRTSFYKKYQPDFVSRVGEGDVGKGDKADNLMVWTKPPVGKGIDKYVTKVNFQDLDSSTQKEILDGGGSAEGDYYVAGLSLKTYYGGNKTTAGETYGFVGLNDRIGSRAQLGAHETFVVNQMKEAGLSDDQINAARGKISDLAEVSNFCRSIVANDSFQLRGRNAEDSQKVLVSSLKTTMKQFGIKMPLDDPQYLEKLKGQDGLIDTKSLSRFSTHLEKEMHMKMIDKDRDKKTGELSPNSPMLHALLMIGADAGLDSVSTPLGVMTNTKTNETHVYNQNEEIMRPVREAISGDRQTQMTRGGLKVDGNFEVNLKNARNRVGIACLVSSKEEDLELID